jgi:hypothetical protein
MYSELDLVVLKHDVGEFSLKAGYVGTIAHSYPKSVAFEVEFLTAEGKIVAVLTLTPEDIRPRAAREILHVRELTSIPS